MRCAQAWVRSGLRRTAARAARFQTGLPTGDPWHHCLIHSEEAEDGRAAYKTLARSLRGQLHEASDEASRTRYASNCRYPRRRWCPADDRRAEAQEAVAAAESWFCSDRSAQDGHRPLELTLRDGVLIEGPYGVQRYTLLVNNAHAIIGIDHSDDFDPALGLVNIFISTVVIDKAKGNFNISTSVSDKVFENYLGH